MVFDRKTLYALNKLDPDAIVYMDADGRLVRLTRDDFATEDEFLAWKSWSDENFHDEEKRDHIYANHTNPLVENPDKPSLVAASSEAVVMRRSEQEEQARRFAEALSLMRDKLTERQFRRLWLYYAENKTEQEIADMEGVGQRRVSTSITSALEKIKKFLPEG